MQDPIVYLMGCREPIPYLMLPAPCSLSPLASPGALANRLLQAASEPVAHAPDRPTPLIVALLSCIATVVVDSSLRLTHPAINLYMVEGQSGIQHRLEIASFSNPTTIFWFYTRATRRWT